MRDEHELEDVRSQMRDNALFSPGVTAQIDALRASVHAQLRERDIEPTSAECERMWVVAGGVVGQLFASPETTAMLANINNDAQRGGIASLLFWKSGISAYRSENLD